MIQKVNRYSLILFLLSILLETRFSVFKYVSTFCCILIYLCIIGKEKLSTGKISPLSLFLCIASILWAVFHSVFDSEYVRILGQAIIFGLFMQTGKQFTGKWNWKLGLLAISNITVQVIGVSYPMKYLSWIQLILYIATLLFYLDPVLEKIGLEHREARLKKEVQEICKEGE